MATLKYNDVIKKSRDLDCYFGVFQKILCSTTLMQNFIAIAYKWYIIRYIHSNFFTVITQLSNTLRKLLAFLFFDLLGDKILDLIFTFSWSSLPLSKTAQINLFCSYFIFPGLLSFLKVFLNEYFFTDFLFSLVKKYICYTRWWYGLWWQSRGWSRACFQC